MTTRLYGISSSRVIRSIWAIEEVEVDHEHVPTNFAKDAKTDEYRAVNPNARSKRSGSDVVFGAVALG